MTDDLSAKSYAARCTDLFRRVVVATVALMVVLSVLVSAFAVTGAEARSPHGQSGAGISDPGPQNGPPLDPGPSDSESASTGSAAGTEVTLVTGQTVTVVERNGERRYHVDADVSMQQVSTQRGTYVFPTDVDFETFAPHLFNVDFLIEQNLTDAETDSIPIIVKQRPADRGPPSDVLQSTPAADHRRTLASIDAVAASVEKTRAGRASEMLARNDDVSAVTLDIKYRIELDEAPEQVSAPEARQRYNVSGEGVTVAVIDTGIDDTHPDLNGSVVRERDFTDDGTTADEYGHGTHVAGILAGDGTASNGTYTGVAPNASLVNAKVLNAEGWGYTSWIVDGMEYAVNHSADVISMSLGGTAYDERSNDRYREGVAYAADNDVAVVTSAGNAGDSYRTIGTPAIHESVITVGATNETGEMAWFSSRGPTPRGLYVKPDVVAPGVDVTSAASSEAGYTDDYVTFSGTSMSTPIVSGTAALLLEQHENWSAQRVKSALTTTADPIGPEDVYTQGAGLVNATEAIDGSLAVTPGTVDFGTYSNDTTASRAVTVTNHGESNVTVNVSASAVGVVQNVTAPVSVNRSRLDLAPGERAHLELTVDTNVSNGAYSGRLSLDDEYTAIFGFVRAHEVVVEKRAIDNTSIEDDYVWLFSDERGAFETTSFQGFRYVSNGTVEYTIIDGGTHHLLSPGDNENNEQTIISSRQVDVAGNRRVVLDEQDTAEHSLDLSAVTEAHGPISNLSVQVTAHKTTSGGRYTTAIYRSTPDSAAVRFGTDAGLNVSTKRLIVPAPNGSAAYDVPAVYHLLHVAQGVSGDRVDQVDRDDLARHDVTYHRTSKSETYNASRALRILEPWNELFVFSTIAGIGDRRSQQVYLTPDLALYGLSVHAGTGSDAWYLDEDWMWPTAAGETMSSGVNDHPYVGRTYLFFDNESGDHSVAAYAYPQNDAGPDRRDFSDGANDTATLRFNGTTVHEENETDGFHYVSKSVDPGTAVEVEVVGRNDATPLSTRTVTTTSTTYDPDSDNRPPVIWNVSADRLDTENSAPNGTVVFRFAASDYESNVSVETALVSNESVETVPFTDSGTNPDGRWIDASVESLGGDMYEARADVGNYSGTVNVAVRVTNDDGSVTEFTTFDGFYVEDVPPEADFETNVTPVNVSRPVEFDGTASWDNRDVASYEWVFHDGTSASGATVNRSYDDLGNYSVELTVTDTGGYTDTVNRTVVVADEYPPNATVTANVTTAEVNLTDVGFDANDSTDNHEIAYYLWDVDGDGTVDANTTTPTASQVYHELGTATATVTVVDEHGNEETDTVSITVQDTTPPDAGFVANETRVNVSEPVGVDAGSTTDNHRLAGFDWTFGDGANATGETAVHAYDAPGNYTVTLTATDESGNQDTANVTVEVVDQVPPDASVTANVSTAEVNETAVGFDASASTDDDEIDRYEWDVDGDGTVDEVTTTPSTSQIYHELGTVDVTVTVVDESGNEGTDTVSITVQDTTPPDASFVANETRVNTSEAIGLDASPTTDNHRLAGFDWTFGDGANATGERVEHAYDAPGNYTVSLTATDESGNEGTANVTIEVVDETPPDASVTANVTTAEVNSTAVGFDANDSTDNHGIASYRWDVDGDGTVDANTTSPTTSHVYEDLGTVNATVIVVDEHGNEGTDTVSITVQDTTSPLASVSANETSVEPNHPVAFDGSNSSDNYEIDRYEWDFDGDGSVDATGEAVTRSFVEDGDHEIVLTVTDASGNDATDAVSIHVADLPPVADAGDDRTVLEEEHVSLNGTGSYEPNGGSLDFHWEQIDGKRAKLTNESTATPEFTAPKTNKRVELVFEVTVTDQDGETDTDTVSVFVESRDKKK